MDRPQDRPQDRLLDRLAHLWTHLRGPLAVAASVACLLCWRHGAPAWVLEGFAVLAALLWIKSDE